MSKIILTLVVFLTLVLQLTTQQLLGGRDQISNNGGSSDLGPTNYRGGSDVAQSHSDIRQSFDEHCNSTLRCDSRKSLRCIQETCKCTKPEEMVFDKSKEKCLVLSGERCSYTTLPASSHSRLESQWVEILDCVPNASCASDGYCRCSNSHKELPQGTCVPKGLNDAPCTKSMDCREDKNLVCFEEKCRCPPSDAVFDPITEECVALANTPCSKYRGCVRNARCSADYSRRRRKTYTNEYVCTCIPPFKASAKGFCLGNFGEKCDPNKQSPCLETFACENGRCNCMFPEHQFYDASKSRCVSYVHGPCSISSNNATVNETGNGCMENSECQFENGVFQCICKPGYIESKGRVCDLEFGHVCEESTAICDRVAGLKCKDGVCQCSDLQFFDLKTSTCRGLVGARCYTNASSDFCLNGGNCVSYRDKSKGEGICLCPEGKSQDRKNKLCADESSSSESTSNSSETPLNLET